MIYLLTDFNDISEDIIDKLIEKLPSERKKRALEFRNFSAKTNCVLAYLLFLYGYQKETGNCDTPEFTIQANGKPFLKDYPDFFFNLSHCSTGIACAIFSAPIGLDIQNQRRISDSILTKVCTDNEIRMVKNSNNPENTFCKIWSIKESVVKLTGEGISRDLKNIDYSNYVISSKSISHDTYLSYAYYVEEFTQKKTDLEIFEVSLNDLIN